jgi:hypothetical protein
MKSINSNLKTLTLLILLLISYSTVYSQNWSPLGGGTNWEYSLCVYNNELYAGMQSGNGGSGLFKWDGTNWSNFGNINGTVQALTVYGGKLIVGGSFSLAGGMSVLNIASWDGSQWSDVGGGPDNIVSALTVYNNELIVGGYFITVEGVNANYIAKYGTGGWAALGSGMGGGQGQVMSLTTWNGLLVAGGFFTTAGGVTVNHIATWNGTSWNSLNGGTNSIVYGLGTYNGSLMAGGLFSNAGGISANCVASWNGSNWSALGTGCGGGFYPYVFAFATYGSNLYIGGLYTIAGGQTVNGIVRWDGSAYHSLGTGFSSGGSNVFGAFALTIFNNNLIAGGIFSSVNGVGAGNVAQWNGLSVTGIHKTNGTVADNYSLAQNYPNPFNPSTKIKYQIPNSENVKLTVYDILGNEVAILINEKQAAGTHEISWNASNVSSGVYLYKITAGSYSDTRRMTLVK